MGKGVEVGKLPGKEEEEQCEWDERVGQIGKIRKGKMEEDGLFGCRPEGSSGGRPAHDWSDAPNDGAHPSIGHGEPLHRGIDCGV